MKTYAPILSWFAALAIIASGCDAEAPSGAAGELTLTTATLGLCSDPATGAELQNGSSDFPDGAKTVILRVTGGDLQAPIVETFTQLNGEGQAVVPEIPPNVGLQVEVVGCTEDGIATWAGVSEPFDLPEAGLEANVNILLTPRDTLARTGRCTDADATSADPSEGHAHASLATVGEQTWVFGGFESMTAGSGSEKSLTAGSTVEFYDRVASQFSQSGALSEPRAGALAQPLGDGRVRLVGGVTRVRTAALDQPNFAAVQGPVAGIEIYDTVAGASVMTSATRFPAMASVVGLADGRALVVGGVNDGGGYSQDAWVVPSGAPEDTAIEAGRLSLGSERYGATVMSVGSQALVWGGAVADPSAARGVWLDGDAGTAWELSAVEDVANTMFAAGHHLDSTDAVHRFVVLGGATIDAAGNHELAVNGAHGLLVSVDTASQSVTTSPLDFAEEAGQLQRAGASLVPLADGSFWFVGGFQAFGFSAGGPCGGTGACLPSRAINFDVAQDGSVSLNAERSLDLPNGDGWEVGAFGIGMAPQSDHSWLIVPGFVRVDLEGEGAESEAPSAHAALVRFQVAAEALCEVDDAPSEATSPTL
ncbi:MAG: hypothetical protein ACPGU1_05435 [Myxococcota bacterium]